MKYLILVLVSSVFLGTEFLAISTPFAQLTIYRMCALSIPVLILYFLIQKNHHVKLKSDSYATFSVIAFVFWWLWSVISFLWIEDFRLWLQAVFLLTLGISSVLGIYFWNNSIKDWLTLIKTTWVMMSLLVGLGYYEIITNNYYFADMNKLDKYATFTSQPMTRIPITHFENQNDFATMLLAYIAVALILFYVTPHFFKRIGYLMSVLLGSYLIFRSGSRMILLCLILYVFFFVALQFKWDFKIKYYVFSVIFLAVLFLGAVIYVPKVQNFIDTLIYTSSTDIITGDTGRVNLLRNGMIFLASTLGVGVGAGNIESWMKNYRFLPTQNIVNIHNWWGEILVAYGIIVFIIYILAYGFLIYRLFQIRKTQDKRARNVSNQLISFLIVYIFASITSANNILIEWHWIFFGLIIAYIKNCEVQLENKKDNNETRDRYEFNYNFK